MQGVKLTRLIWILQTSLEMFDKNSTDKIQSKIYKEVNPPCLMPIRVNPWLKTSTDIFKVHHSTILVLTMSGIFQTLSKNY